MIDRVVDSMESTMTALGCLHGGRVIYTRTLNVGYVARTSDMEATIAVNFDPASMTLGTVCASVNVDGEPLNGAVTRKFCSLQELMCKLPEVAMDLVKLVMPYTKKGQSVMDALYGVDKRFPVCVHQVVALVPPETAIGGDEITEFVGAFHCNNDANNFAKLLEQHLTEKMKALKVHLHVRPLYVTDSPDAETFVNAMALLQYFVPSVSPPADGAAGAAEPAGLKRDASEMLDAADEAPGGAKLACV